MRALYDAKPQTQTRMRNIQCRATDTEIDAQPDVQLDAQPDAQLDVQLNAQLDAGPQM